MQKFVIIGTERGGTLYTSLLMRLCGVNCSHERIFSFSNFGYNWIPGIAGESSWMALPYLKSLKDAGIKIFHQRRDKELVLDAFRRNKSFSSYHNGNISPAGYNKYYNTVFRLYPDLIKSNYEETISAVYDFWNAEAEKYADKSFNINKINPELIGMMLYSCGYSIPMAEIERAISILPRSVNTTKPITYEGR